MGLAYLTSLIKASRFWSGSRKKAIHRSWSGIFATSVRPIILHIDDDAGALWIVSPESELTLDTPCEVLA